MSGGSDRRARLAERIYRLPLEKLQRVEEFVSRLECEDLSKPSTAEARSTSDLQRLAAGISPERAGKASSQSKDWPHAPTHRLSEYGTYIVTAGTLHKEHWFRGRDRLALLESALLSTLKAAGWQVEAWAIFSNHYHFVAHSQPAAEDLRAVLKQLHGATSHDLNMLDGTPGRTVWHNFWDARLTFERSYLARLNYVHQNAVKHGLVPVANQYPWCSAAWFERSASRAQVRTIYRFKIDRLKVPDDYEPI